MNTTHKQFHHNKNKEETPINKIVEEQENTSNYVPFYQRPTYGYLNSSEKKKNGELY